jgi:hypothetical protein
MASTQPYCTVPELKAQIQKNANDDDAILTGIILAASRAIDGFCNRPDGFIALAAAVPRLYTGHGTPVLRIDECVEVTLVETKLSVSDSTFQAWAADDWIPFRGSADSPNFNDTPYTGLMVSGNGNQVYFQSGNYLGREGFKPSSTANRGLPTVRVTARWGFADTVAPPTVKQATITQAARWYKRGQSSWADTLASGDTGMLMFRKAIDPDVQMMLEYARLIQVAVGGKR